MQKLADFDNNPQTTTMNFSVDTDTKLQTQDDAINAGFLKLDNSNDGGFLKKSKTNQDSSSGSDSGQDDAKDSGFFKTSKTEKLEPSKPFGFLQVGFDELNQDFKLPATFKKLKKLGAGAYGKVMQVMHIPSKATYAVKRFEEIFTRELRARRLLRELTILKSVKHPCLNKLRWVVAPENINDFNDAYLILDPCDMDLKKLLKSSKHLQEEQVKSIIYDILCGLNYLHKSQIIHRDLKPANILINDDCTIQICDFGLARSIKGVFDKGADFAYYSSNNNILSVETEEEDIQTAASSGAHKKDEEQNQINLDLEAKNDSQVNLLDNPKDIAVSSHINNQEEQKAQNRNSGDSIGNNGNSQTLHFQHSKTAPDTLESAQTKTTTSITKPSALAKSKLTKTKGVRFNEQSIQPSSDKKQARESLSMQGKKLTQHVVTRWYRAPEVILLQDAYTSAIDIWSVGCIFAELLSMMKENYATVFDRQPLFPGSSCFPLSPGATKNPDEEIKEFADDQLKNDQLSKIFEVIGTPQSSDDLDFIKQENAIKYIKSFPRREKLDFQDKYPGTDPQGIELLYKMLEFNPAKRIQAEEALRNPYFDDVRIPEQEEFQCTEEIDLTFDDEELTVEEVKQLVINEIKRCSEEEMTKNQ